MLRALLLGVLAASTAASCKGKSDTPAVAVGTPAGKVVELAGKVEATREGKTRALAVGSEVFGDDQIATADDGTVTIELFHNGARWSVVSNKSARVDASLAWGLDKQAASKTVDHNSAAAGRNAERSAAETASTTATNEARAQESKPTAAPVTAAAPAEPVPAPGSPAPDSVADEAPKDREDRSAEGGGGTPPPPPPPPPRPKTAAPRKPAQEREVAAVITPQAVAERHRAELARCLDPQAPKVTITFRVRANQTTVALAGPGNVTAKVRSCVEAIAQKIDWPVTGATFEVALKFD